MTMAITTLIFFRVLTDRWGWARWKAMLVCVPMLVAEFGFLGANIPKIPHGGWFALGIGGILMVQMSTWRRGRQLVAARIRRGERPIHEVLDEHNDIKRVSGTGVFLFKDLGQAPPALVNNLRHNKVLHRTTLIVSVDTGDTPRVDPTERAVVTKVEPGVFQVLLSYGFMEDPDVPQALGELTVRGLTFDPDDVTYFIGRESVVAGKAPGMHPAFEHLFVWLNRGADSAVRFFKTTRASGRARRPNWSTGQTAWHTICEWELPYSKWFVGGQLNVSYNCLDRHVRRARATRSRSTGRASPATPAPSPTPSCSPRCRSSPTR
jgi:KUP system potassium uptake protein